MAERFTKFDGGGIQYAGGPNIDFADLREQAKASQSMTATADRLSSYFMKIATEQAAVEGAAYYAENPLTLEQLEQAKALDQDPEDLFAGNFTAFDKAGRKVQLQQISAEIEMTARTELMSMLADVKLGKANLSSMTDMSSGSPRPGGKLADLIDGLSSTIKDAAPELYPTVRANLSILANSTLSSAIGEIATRTEKQRKLRAEKGVNDVINGIPGIIARGPTIDPITKNTITVEEHLLKEKVSLDSYAAYANDPTMLKQARDSYDTATTKARQAALEDWADMMPGGPGAALSQIRRGKFESPAMEAAYKALPEDKQLEVRASVRTLRSNRRADRAQARTDAQGARDDADAALEDDWLVARKDGDIKGMNDAVAAMSEGKRKDYQDLMRDSPTGYKVGKAGTVAGLKTKIITSGSNVTSSSMIADVKASLEKNTITHAESVDLYSMIIQRQDKRLASARQRISAATRYDPNADTTSLNKEEVARRKAVYENAMKDLATAYDAAPDLNIEGWIGRNLAGIERSETERALFQANKELKFKINLFKGKGTVTPATTRDELVGMMGNLPNNDQFIAQQILDLMGIVDDFNQRLGVKK